jgi:hypothetical protein
MYTICDLPSQLLWIILEYHLRNNKDYFGKGEDLYTPHWTSEHWAWDRHKDYTTILTSFHPVTLTSLLRSVCKKFKNCIDQNSHFDKRIVPVVSYVWTYLCFKKRDYIVGTNMFKKIKIC